MHCHWPSLILRLIAVPVVFPRDVLMSNSNLCHAILLARPLYNHLKMSSRQQLTSIPCVMCNLLLVAPTNGQRKFQRNLLIMSLAIMRMGEGNWDVRCSLALAYTYVFVLILSLVKRPIRENLSCFVWNLTVYVYLKSERTCTLIHDWR